LYHCGGKEHHLRARRPKAIKLALNPTLRAIVEAKLEERWSPQQISASLSITCPDNKEIHVSHETFYLSLFVQGRGGLRRQLHKYLRTGRTQRRGISPHPYEGQGYIPRMVLIGQPRQKLMTVRSLVTGKVIWSWVEARVQWWALVLLWNRYHLR